MSLVWHDENWTNKIFLTMNKEWMFFVPWRLQGMKIFYHKQISQENIQRWIFSKLQYIANFLLKHCKILIYFCHICQTQNVMQLVIIINNYLHSLVGWSGHVSCKVAMYILIVNLMLTLNEILSSSCRVFNFNLSSVNGLCEANALVYHLVSSYCNFK